MRLREITYGMVTALLLCLGSSNALAGDKNTIDGEHASASGFFTMMSFWPFRAMCVGGCDKGKVINEQAQDTFSEDNQMNAHGVDPDSPEGQQIREMLDGK